MGLEPRERRGRVLAAVEADARLRRGRNRAARRAPGSVCCTRTTRLARESIEREPRAGRGDLRRRVPAAPQGRSLHPRALARLSGPQGTGRTGRAHRRHPPRHHRAETDRGGAARKPGAAHARVCRRPGRRLGLEHRNQRGRVLAALETDARLRRGRNRTAHQRLGAPGAPGRPAARRRGERQRRARRADLRSGIPAAAQGRPLRPRAVARISGPPRSPADRWFASSAPIST